MSKAEYLLFERAAPLKHEFYRGEARCLDGEPPAHNQLGFRLQGLLFAQYDLTDCVGYTSRQRLCVQAASAYFYPDLTLVCSRSAFDKTHSPESLVNPTLIVEILSKSTANQDRGEKFMLYRQISSLKQYLLLDSTTIHAELYTRQPATDHWLLTETRELNAVLDLSSVGGTLPLARLYQGVELASTSADG